MKKVIGNFIVEVGESVLMIKNLKGDLLKAESVKPFDSDEKFKQLCIDLTNKIAERKEAGKSV
tara:strand:+ start:794 stop:982 length:189 start_codon:yes stop_codon:yes gene_type:complete